MRSSERRKEALRGGGVLGIGRKRLGSSIGGRALGHCRSGEGEGESEWRGEH